MNRKDYDLIAAVLSDQLTEAFHDPARVQAESYIEAVARDLAWEFKARDPEFDEAWFLMESVGEKPYE